MPSLSPARTPRAVVPHMLAQLADAHGARGKIVNVGAYGAQRGVAQMGVYGASKARVIRMTESMAAELREQGINVNCVLPTTLDRPQNRADMPTSEPNALGRARSAGGGHHVSRVRCSASNAWGGGAGDGVELGASFAGGFVRWATSCPPYKNFTCTLWCQPFAARRKSTHHPPNRTL